MLPRGSGAILFTGASASVKGYPQSAAFAMGKFALRGLAQSMARELAPQGIHVAHFVIDGGIRNHAHRSGGQAGQPARSGRHRRQLLACRAAATQRMDLGGRAAPMGGTVLTAGMRAVPGRWHRPVFQGEWLRLSSKAFDCLATGCGEFV